MVTIKTFETENFIPRILVSRVRLQKPACPEKISLMIDFSLLHFILIAVLHPA